MKINCLKPSLMMLLFLLLFVSASFNTVAAQNDELSKLRIELADAEASYLMIRDSHNYVGKSLLAKRIEALERKIRDLESVQSTIPSSTSSSLTIVANGVSFKMIRVEGGTFTMGATSEQGSDFVDDDKPAHRVTLSSYYIGETEVTQALWEAVMGSNPSNFKGANHPVENVSWNDCKIFISKLNAITGKTFRLPTEAEWEYAARGGKKSKGYKYSGSNTLGNVAWYGDNSGNETHDVKTKSPNELGLYDMSGNVWEWCQDWYDDYSSSSQTNPTGPSSGSLRVSRGGGWWGGASYCRMSGRGRSKPDLRDHIVGLRLAL